MGHISNAEAAVKTNEPPQKAWKIAVRCGIPILLAAVAFTLFIYAIPWIEMAFQKFIGTDFGVEAWFQRTTHAAFLMLTLGGTSLLFALFGSMGSLALGAWILCIHCKLKNGIPEKVLILSLLCLFVLWLAFYASAQSLFVSLSDLPSMELVALFVASIPIGIFALGMLFFLMVIN